MKIKRLEIVGFKSFVDRTIVDFDHAITAIVGPNGCGKSNVVDAIKWVMGEQSPKMLRGGSMSDVIFNGSEVRGPAQFAEVSLTFDNTDGITPPEYAQYAEITVTRRLNRDGRSDYIINKAPVRLMDVTNLFLGTGVGRRAYSTIEQGRIGFIVSSKPEDRRHMIEEAAGITKFKVRKQTAERKMEQTRANLQRLDDITSELERSLASLKRQAQKAERYQEYRKELRELEVYLSSFRYLELFTEEKYLGVSAEAESNTLLDQRLQLEKLEADSEAERAAIDALGRQAEQAQAITFELDNQVRIIEGRIQQASDRQIGLKDLRERSERELIELRTQRERLAEERERILQTLDELSIDEESSQEMVDAELDALEERRVEAQEAERFLSRLREQASELKTRIVRAEAILKNGLLRREEAAGRGERLRAEREELEARILEATEEKLELEARLEGLRGGKESTLEEREALEQELGTKREAYDELGARVDSLREELALKRSRLRSLEEIAQRFEGVGAGVRALMERAESDSELGLLGLLADRIECPPEYTRALAGALGERLEDIIVREASGAARAIAWLKEGAKGRAGLLPLDLERKTYGPAPSAPEIVGRLHELVRAEGEAEAMVGALLAPYLVVESLDAALRLHRAHPGFAFVTLDGELVTEEGRVRGGAGEDEHGHLIEVKSEISAIAEEVSALELEFEATDGERRTLRERIARIEASLETARAASHETALSVVAAEKDLRSVEDELARIRRRVSELSEETAGLSSHLAEMEDEEAEARAELDGAYDEEQALESQFMEAEERFDEKRNLVDEQSARLTEVRVRAAQAKQRAESERNALDRLELTAHELDQREDRLRGDLERAERESLSLVEEAEKARNELDAAVDLAREAREDASTKRAAYEEARGKIGGKENEIRELRQRVERQSEGLNEKKMRLREIAIAKQHLLEGVAEKWHVDLREELIHHHAKELPDAATITRIDELTKLIDRMGPINLMAIEEYEEKNQRFRYLDEQRSDLLDSLAQLEKAIRQMNKESRELFRDAFVGINERFKRVFPTLFRGGSGELKLTDPSDLLGSGVDIVAQPPGKKLGSLELMSGGEKALTAVAFIFAIFQYKPSPFCILDEVDAPLDEANVARFAEAIGQMTDHSQFIVITHSKRTMEYADVLYGVTMEKPGISNLISVELRGEKRPAA